MEPKVISQREVASIHRSRDGKLPSPIPDNLERINKTQLEPGQIVYYRAASQYSNDNAMGSFRGLNRHFYPCKITEDGKLELLCMTPSFPPGYGLDHRAGTVLEIDNQELYVKIDA